MARRLSEAHGGPFTRKAHSQAAGGRQPRLALPALRVSPVIVGVSLRDKRILSGVVEPEAQFDRTDLKPDAGSLNLIALDHILVRPLPERDGPRIQAAPEPHLDPTDPHRAPAALRM